MENIFWQSQFPQVYERVKQLPEAGQTPPSEWLLLALEHELLTSEDYLAAAQRYFGLAILNDPFFTEQFSPEIYEKYKNEFNWSAQSLPIFEWDGVVFVACLDPHQVPSDLETTYRPLLASQQGLKWAWKKVNSGSSETLESVPSQQQNSAEQNLFDLIDTPLSSEEEPVSSEESASLEGDQNHDFEMPEGLSFGSSSPPSSTSPDDDEGIFGLPTQPPPAPSAVKLAPPPPPAGGPSASVPVAPPVPKAPPRAPAPPLVAVAPPPPIVEAPAPTPETITAYVKKEISTPTQEIEEELMLCFAKAFQTYRNLMILKVVGDSVIPYRWDPSYRPPRTMSPIGLAEPSIFRIVTTTEKPFHGSVTTNAVNSQFFESWFGGHQPLWVTIIPLFFDNTLVGLLLAASDDEELDRKSSLELMLSTAQKVEQNFSIRIAA